MQPNTRGARNVLPTLERLETRLTPAVTFGQVGNVLFVSGDQFDNVLTFAPNPVDPGPNNVFLSADGATASFANVFLLSVESRQGDDTVSNQTTIPMILLAGSGRDDVVDFGQPANGFGSFLDLGPGADDAYAITAPVLVRGGSGPDRLVVSVQATILDLSPEDAAPVIFGQTQTTPVQLIDKVVYFQGTVADDNASLTQDGNGNFTVVYNGQTFAFDAGQVIAFAGLFGAGNDLVDGSGLNTARLIAYGTGGDDILLGGASDDLLKGGGADDMVTGNDGNDDLTGDGGLDVLSGGKGKDVLRNLDGADLVFADGFDLVVQLGVATPRRSRAAALVNPFTF